MYSYIIKLAHGFCLIPTILAFKHAKIFQALKKPKSLEELAIQRGLNSGYLNAGLNLLHVFSILKKNKNKYYYKKKNNFVNLINNNFLEFYKYDFKDLLFQKKTKKILGAFKKKLLNGWKIKDLDDTIINGCFLLPLLFSIKANKQINFLNDNRFLNIQKILLSKNFLKKKNNNYIYSSIGSYIIKNINIAGVVASYKNLLYNYRNLLIIKKFKILKNNKNSLSKKEIHIQRKLNIEASASQHEKYFAKILALVESIFKKKKNPLYIMDVGCGDGSLLKKIYLFLVQNFNKTQVKKIKLIAVDLNEISIVAAKKNLEKIKTIFIKESVDNPEKIFNILKTKKIYPKDILQVRSFVDHERFIDTNKMNFTNDTILKKFDPDVFGVDDMGKNINSLLINFSLDDYYKKWAKFIGSHGLINLEVHKQTFKDLKNNVDLNEGVNFDFIQILSNQYLCKSKIQQYCMIKNNLVPKIIETFPTNTNFIRITLSYYKKKQLDKKNKKKLIYNLNKILKLK